MAGDVAGIVDAAGEDGAAEGGVFEAVNPAGEACDGALGRCFGFVLGGGGEHVDVAEVVGRGVEGVAAVDDDLHLCTHLIIIYRSGPADDVGIVHLLDDAAHIVLHDTDVAAFAAVEVFGTVLLGAGKAALAEADVEGADGDLLDLVARLLRTTDELVGEGVGVAVVARACGDY